MVVLPGLTLVRLVQLRDLVQQLAGLRWVCNPRRRACQTCLEVVRPSAQELVTNVQCLASLNVTKNPLTGQYAPALVSNIYKDIVATYKMCQSSSFET